MAKTDEEQAAEGDLTLSARIERQQRAKLLKSATEKARKGQSLNRGELAALKAMEAERLAKYGAQYFSAMPKGEFLRLAGGSSKVYIQWHEGQGFPWPHQTATVDVGAVLRWYRERFVQGSTTVGGDVDDVLLAMASQELKDQFVRERIREKEITNQLKTIELQKAVEGLVPLEPIRTWHNALAGHISKTREKLARDADPKFRERVDEAFEDLAIDMQRLMDEQFGDGRPGEE